MSKKILFFGNERLATGVTTDTPALRALIAAGYEVGAIIVAQNDVGKSRKARPLEVADLAKEYDIPVLAPADLIKAKDELAAYEAEAAVLIAYGKIVPPEILAIFPADIVNIHPSLLPLHRGSAPLESVILEGAAETGVSLMKLSETMDTGPLYAQQTVALDGNETKQALADKLATVGTDMLLQHLPGIMDGTAKLSPQDDSAATYDAHIKKADGRVDWSKPAKQLEREVRAYSGWPRSAARLGDSDIIITSARTVEGAARPGTVQIDSQELRVGCGEGLLVIDRLIPAGKREMSASAFLAGHKLL